MLRSTEEGDQFLGDLSL